MKSNMRADETATAAHKYVQEVCSFGRDLKPFETLAFARAKELAEKP
jgi:hypothetical protein